MKERDSSSHFYHKIPKKNRKDLAVNASFHTFAANRHLNPNLDSDTTQSRS